MYSPQALAILGNILVIVVSAIIINDFVVSVLNIFAVSAIWHIVYLATT